MVYFDTLLHISLIFSIVRKNKWRQSLNAHILDYNYLNISKINRKINENWIDIEHNFPHHTKFEEYWVRRWRQKVPRFPLWVDGLYRKGDNRRLLWWLGSKTFACSYVSTYFKTCCIGYFSKFGWEGFFWMQKTSNLYSFFFFLTIFNFVYF